MPAPRQEQFFALLLSVWAGVFTWSIIGFSMHDPVGDGFTRGLNRITVFLIWQFAAAAVSVAVFLNGRAYPRGSALRWVSRVPLALAAAIMLVIAGLLIYELTGAV